MLLDWQRAVAEVANLRQTTRSRYDKPSPGCLCREAACPEKAEPNDVMSARRYKMGQTRKTDRAEGTPD